MKVYNSLTRQKEEFKTIEPGKVRMYVCGPTVYNYFHIGNARPFTVFDAFRSYLEYRGYEVNYVQNFTDVDDKIIQKANEEKLESIEVSEKYIEEYFKDADQLGIRRATVHPKVTETIPEIMDFIAVLIQKGYAYAVEGDVYFDTKAFNGYGKLSKQNLDELELGARIEVNTAKKHPMDFVLWKSKKPGEPFWVSPWGEGRPGWHIECSVMSTKYLGESIDVHCGGQDLMFPHHENEIAQSEAYSGQQFATYWMHNGYININNEKMSKSKNNFFTVRDILEEFDGEVLRLFILSAHYRSPINFSKDLIEASGNALERLYNAKENLEHRISHNRVESLSDVEAADLEKLSAYREQFIAAMDDDLNTADALAAIFELVRESNTLVTESSSKAFADKALAILLELTGVLGLLGKDKGDLDAYVEGLIVERAEARKTKNFARADAIRDELKEKGIVLEDTPQGVKWSYAKRGV